MADARFHLHLETGHKRPAHLQLTDERWRAAAARHPELAKQLRITIGWDGDILDEALKTADFMINQTPPRDRFRERAPKLKWIQTTGAGVDAITPLDWLPPDVMLTNHHGGHSEKAEETCMLALLAIHTRLKTIIDNQQRHVWQMLVTPRIAGRKVLVIGYGNLGQGAVRAAKKLGLHVTALSRTGSSIGPADEVLPSTAIDDALPRADFVIVAAPVTAETRALLDRRRIGLMKSGASLINIARAAIVDYDALSERLQRGELAGAVLDVFNSEPLAADSPLWDVPNLMVTPHISCDVPDYIDYLLDFWFGNFQRFLGGEPMLNRIERQRGY